MRLVVCLFRLRPCFLQVFISLCGVSHTDGTIFLEIMNSCLKPARAGALMILACLLLLAGCEPLPALSPAAGMRRPASQPAMPSAASLFRTGRCGVENEPSHEAERPQYNVVARDAAFPRISARWRQGDIGSGGPFQRRATRGAPRNALKFWKDLVPERKTAPQ